MNDNWIPIEDAFKKETEVRENIDTSKLCTYGIKPLDDSLVCMAKNELVVIGADSGVGKSEMILNIARTNIKDGKRVALFYLEGGYIEAMQRMKWMDITDEYYKNYSHEAIDMNYKKWVLNKIKSTTLMEIENIVWEKYKKDYKNNLLFYSAKEGLDVEKFINSLWELHRLIPNDTGLGISTKLDLDLIIIDHLQYFSLMKAESEIFETTEILRAVKNITETFKVPVVLVSHLRKKAKDRGLPSQEDFYGSSNIPKIATTAITIANDTEKDNLRSGIYPTYIRVVKSRVGIKPNYAFLVDFNLSSRSYEEHYQICRLDNYGNVCANSLTKEEKPDWSEKRYQNE